MKTETQFVTVKEARNNDKTKARPTRFVYTRPPYFVRIRGKQIGEYHTLEEAAFARDEYLKKNP